MARSTFFVRAATALGLVAISLGVLATSPAGAASSSTDQQPQPPARTFLVLAVTPLNSASTLAYLTCEPPGGTHPQAEAACGDLEKAGGDFTKLPGDPEAGACADVWDPVVASAFGVWKGRTTWWLRVYSNQCELEVTCGPVFNMRITRITDPAEANAGA